MKKYLFSILLSTIFMPTIRAQVATPRIWNEAQLAAIRIDAARPPVQARNLYHVAIAMYDAWAAYDNLAKPYLLGSILNGVNYPFVGVPVPADVTIARNKAISYAAYRVLYNRYAISPNWATTKIKLDSIFLSLGYDSSITTTNYSSGNPAELGNYIAQKVISMGLGDGSNQSNNYGGIGYVPSNPALVITTSGNSTMINPNAWQPLTYVTCVDQNGNPCGTNTPAFVCPHWGNTLPFSMPKCTADPLVRSGANYPVYHNPGPPPMLNTTNVNDPSSDDFKLGHSMVVAWSAHLDPNDPTVWDISPGGHGNVQNYPTTYTALDSFYKFTNGGDLGTGHPLNPATGLPYAPQLVKRGDYTRVASQYWADGPTSETPPGHWFKLLNEASLHPSMVKKFEGVGPVLSDLEWYIKSYFTMGAALHDAAIACWGAKGYYDASRPVSTIRKMAEYGQSSSVLLPNYHPGGLKLIPNLIEQVISTDPVDLRGINNENLGKIKVRAWRAFPYIIYSNGTPLNSAGVGWILAANWMPYQRETFVSPPFGGYFSGHSTYSRAGATIMTDITGDPYFPGGYAEYVAPANGTFLGFEQGPSTTVKLQWATYMDASDEASLSRIWGGIHPPFDDLPARAIGTKVANECFKKAKAYFNSDVIEVSIVSNLTNPVCNGSFITFTALDNNVPANAVYVWRKNNLIVSSGSSSTFVTSEFANNDKFNCEIQGNGYSVASEPYTVSTINCSACTVTSKQFVQGYYFGGGLMGAVLEAQGIGTNATLTDSITIELHATTAPYELIARKTAALMTSGLANAIFTCQQANYYLIIKHRNCTQTWSANPITLSTAVSYDFTDAANKAYGSNQTNVSVGTWAFFSGDISQDENIDLQDYGLYEIDNLSFASGYLASDINGDGNVDLGDVPMLEANMNSFIFSNHP